MPDVDLYPQRRDHSTSVRQEIDHTTVDPMIVAHHHGQSLIVQLVPDLRHSQCVVRTCAQIFALIPVSRLIYR